MKQPHALQIQNAKQLFKVFYFVNIFCFFVIEKHIKTSRNIVNNFVGTIEKQQKKRQQQDAWKKRDKIQIYRFLTRSPWMLLYLFSR